MIEPDFVHLFIPPTAGASRVLLLLHGTGGEESDLIPLGRELDPTAALLSPRGQVLEGGNRRFFRRFAEGVFDEADVIRRAHELADFIVAAATHYRVDLSRLTAVGYSNGANIAAAIMLLRPEVLPAAVLLRAMMPLTHPPTPDLTGRRVMVVAGDADPIIPLPNVRALAALLTKGGAEVRLEIQPASHGLVAADLALAKHWIVG